MALLIWIAIPIRERELVDVATSLAVVRGFGKIRSFCDSLPPRQFGELGAATGRWLRDWDVSLVHFGAGGAVRKVTVYPIVDRVHIGPRSGYLNLGSSNPKGYALVRTRTAEIGDVKNVSSHVGRIPRLRILHAKVVLGAGENFPLIGVQGASARRAHQRYADQQNEGCSRHNS